MAHVDLQQLPDLPDSAYPAGSVQLAEQELPHPVFPWLTTRRRAWLYRVLTAVGALALLYGAAGGDEITGWVVLAAAVLGTGTAAAHTPTSP